MILVDDCKLDKMSQLEFKESPSFTLGGTFHILICNPSFRFAMLDVMQVISSPVAAKHIP